MSRLNVFAEDEAIFALQDHDGADIGSIRGEVITFMGFDDVADAVRAARRGGPAFVRAMCGVVGRAPLPMPDTTRLELVYDGAFEWISDGTLLLARLIRPSTSDRGDGSYGVAFVMPTSTSDAHVIAVAHAVYDALRDPPPVTPPADLRAVVGAPRAAAAHTLSPSIHLSDD